MSQFEYSPLVCNCGTRVIIRTSWTNDNPGRRYRLCQKYKKGGCLFWEWEDPPMCRRSKLIIPGLLRKLNGKDDEIQKLKQRNKSLKRIIVLLMVVCVALAWNVM